MEDHHKKKIDSILDLSEDKKGEVRVDHKKSKHSDMEDKEIVIRVNTRMLERFAYIAVILVLGYFAFFASGSNCLAPNTTGLAVADVETASTQATTASTLETSTTDAEEDSTEDSSSNDSDNSTNYGMNSGVN